MHVTQPDFKISLCPDRQKDTHSFIIGCRQIDTDININWMIGLFGVNLSLTWCQTLRHSGALAEVQCV